MERSDVASRKFEGLQESNGVLFGELTGPVSVNLNGLKFETDLVGGHKTGMYLDQQANYQAVSQFAKGGQVLDCFSFLGGFGLHAARAGRRMSICSTKARTPLQPPNATPPPTASRTNAPSTPSMSSTGSRPTPPSSRTSASSRASTSSSSTRRRSRATAPPCRMRCAATRRFICAR